MRVLLKCKCTDGEVAHVVRDRNDGERIEDYMNHVTRELGTWHQYRRCDAVALEYLKMPLPNDKGIGYS